MNELRKSSVQLYGLRGCEYVQAITRAERSVATDAFRERRLGAAGQPVVEIWGRVWYDRESEYGGMMVWQSLRLVI